MDEKKARFSKGRERRGLVARDERLIKEKLAVRFATTALIICAILIALIIVGLFLKENLSNASLEIIRYTIGALISIFFSTIVYILIKRKN